MQSAHNKFHVLVTGKVHVTINLELYVAAIVLTTILPYNF